MVSGSEVAWNGQWMTLDPDIHLNKAVRVRGRYYVGSWATPYAATSVGSMAASEYFNYMSPGVQRSFSPGYWNLLWLTARLPIRYSCRRQEAFHVGHRLGLERRGQPIFRVLGNYLGLRSYQDPALHVPFSRRGRRLL